MSGIHHHDFQEIFVSSFEICNGTNVVDLSNSNVATGPPMENWEDEDSMNPSEEGPWISSDVVPTRPCPVCGHHNELSYKFDVIICVSCQAVYGNESMTENEVLSNSAEFNNNTNFSLFPSPLKSMESKDYDEVEILGTKRGIDPPPNDPIEKGHQDLTRVQRAKLEAASKKLCQVCGDKAFGYNFDAVTCESCKAFFRRNALKKKTRICSYGNNCKITVMSRRHCQKCRLLKCFQVGMNPEHIRTEKHKTEKRALLKTKNLSYYDAVSSYRDAGRFESGTAGDPALLRTPWDISAEPFRASDVNLEHLGANRDSSSVQFPPVSIVSVDPTIDTPTPPLVSLLSLEGDTVEVKVRLSKSKLVDNFFNNNHRSGQAVALEQALMSSFTTLAADGFITNLVKSVDLSSNPQVPTARKTAPEINRNDAFSTWSAADESDTLPCLIRGSQGVSEGEVSWAGSDDQLTELVSASPTTDMDLDMLDALAASFDEHVDLPILSSSDLYFNLKYYKVEELLLAFHVWNSIEIYISPSKSVVDVNVDDYVTMFRVGAQILISQVNGISDFTDLPHHDQQLLLNECIHELGFLQMLMTYYSDQHRKSKKQIEVDALSRRIRGGIQNESKKIFSTLPDRMCSDHVLLLIIQTIFLFNPDHHGVVNKSVVAAKRGIYLDVLRDYLERTFGENETRSVYDCLIAKIKDLSSLMRKACPRVAFTYEPNTLQLRSFQVSKFY